MSLFDSSRPKATVADGEFAGWNYIADLQTFAAYADQALRTSFAEGYRAFISYFPRPVYMPNQLDLAFG